MIKPIPLSPADKVWAEKKAKLKKQFPFLTEEDLKFESNKKDLMLNHLQITLGKTKNELETLLAAL
jgi:hypothetical protein